MFSITLVGPLVTVGHFYINQQEIEALHCENKDKPAVSCKGHCYLKKQLTNKSNVNKELPQSKLKSIVFLFYNFKKPLSNQRISLDQNTLCFDQYINHYKFLLSNHILDPPEKLII